MTYHGLGIETDQTKDLELVEKAARMRYTLSMRNIGDINSDDFDFPIDIDKARQWYEKLSQNDDGEGQLKIKWLEVIRVSEEGRFKDALEMLNALLPEAEALDIKLEEKPSDFVKETQMKAAQLALLARDASKSLTIADGSVLT